MTSYGKDDWPHVKPLEEMRLPRGYFWASLPASSRFAAVLCVGEWPIATEVLGGCRDDRDARMKLAQHQSKKQSKGVAVA